MLMSIFKSASIPIRGFMHGLLATLNIVLASRCAAMGDYLAHSGTAVFFEYKYPSYYRSLVWLQIAHIPWRIRCILGRLPISLAALSG
jgi:hypothetical protein